MIAGRLPDLKVKFLDGTSREVALAPEADLSGANLSRADLSGADLSGAVLSGADLRGADLRGADLSGANLFGANLRGADLRRADLSGADLSGAILRGAYLRRANLQDAEGLEQFCILPEGELTGYKKLDNGSIATLHIPRQAKRVNAYSSRKCRAEYAYVLDGEGVDKHAGKTQYAKGALITPDSYDPDPRVECSHGVHFFITRKEAEEYN